MHNLRPVKNADYIKIKLLYYYTDYWHRGWSLLVIDNKYL